MFLLILALNWGGSAFMEKYFERIFMTMRLYLIVVRIFRIMGIYFLGVWNVGIETFFETDRAYSAAVAGGPLVYLMSFFFEKYTLQMASLYSYLLPLRKAFIQIANSCCDSV